MIWMKERLISRNGGVVLFLLAVLLACLMISSGGADAASENGYEYSVDGTDATITGYTGPGGDITIPSTLGGNAVVAIGDNAFQDNETITKVIIPSGVISIGELAFNSCPNLTSVTLADSVTSIGSYAFANTGISSISIGSNVTSVGSGVFQNCKLLSNVTYAPTYNTLPAYFVSDCVALTTFTIPANVTEVGIGVFEGCTSLESIIVPNTVTSVGSSLFSDCTKLISVTMSENITSLTGRTFENCVSLTSVSLGAASKITSFGEYVFRGCTSLKTLVLPSGLEILGYCMLENCSSLESISIPDSVTSLSSGLFKGCSSLKTIDIGEDSSINRLGSAMTFEGCTSLEAFFIPKAAEQFDGSYFADCISLTSFSVSNDNEKYEVTDGILYWNYNNSYSLVKYPVAKSGDTYTSPVGLTSMQSSAFEGSTNLRTIDLSTSSITYVNAAFKDCVNLSTLKLPATVSSISTDAFEGCSSLSEFSVAEGSEYFSTSDGVLFDASARSLVRYPIAKVGTEYVIPDTVKTIKGGAFEGCSSLVSVDFGCAEGYVTIGSAAFEGCSSLRSINISSAIGIIYLSGDVFDGCHADLKSFTCERSDCTELKVYTDAKFTRECTDITSAGTVYLSWHYDPYWVTYDRDGNSIITAHDDRSVKTLTVPDTVGGKPVVGLGYAVFRNYPNLESIHLPDSIGLIDDLYSGTDTFVGCTSLKTVNIPAGMTEIVDDMFGDCTSLASITIPEGVEAIGDRAFMNCTSLKSVVLPDSVTTIYGNAFMNCISLETVTIDTANSSLGSIKGSAFENCTNLTSISLPDSMGSILSNAFKNCKSLKSFKIPAIHTISSGMFEGCKSLESVTIDVGTSVIGSYAFKGCSSLKVLNIPRNISSIGLEALYGLWSLTEVNVDDNNTTFYSDRGVLYKSYGGSEYLELYPSMKTSTTYTILAGTKWIDNLAFIRNNYLVTLNLPYSLDDIGEFVWPSNYPNLQNIVIPDGNEHFVTDDGVLYNADMTIILSYPAGRTDKTYTLHKNVLTVGYCSFQFCEHLETVEMLDDVKLIEPGAFQGSKKLKTILVGDGLESVEGIAFSDCVSIESIRMNIPQEGRGLSVDPDQKPLWTDTSIIKLKTGDSPIKVEYGYVHADEDYDLFYTVVPSMYLVAFDANGGEGSMLTLSVEMDESVELLPNMFYRQLFEFKSWNTRADGSGTSYEDRATVSELTDVSGTTVMLYAQWDALTYDIEFDANGGSGEMGGQTMTPNVPTPLNENTYAYDMKTFVSWNTEADGSGISYSDKEVIIDPINEYLYDVTLYAQWVDVDKYSVNFIDHDGSVFESQTYLLGDVIVCPDSIPEKTDDYMFAYVFLEWAGYVDGMTVSGNHVFYPVYNAIMLSFDEPESDVVEIETPTNVIDIGGFITDINGMLTNGIPLDIEFDQGSIEMGADAFSAIDTDNSSIGIVPTNGANVPAEIASKAGDRPVYNVFIGGIHEFDGDLTISFNYVLGEGESAENLRIWHFDDNGNYVTEECTYDSEKKVVTFTTDSLSYFSIMHGTGDPDPGSDPGSESDDDGGVNVVLIVGIVVAVIAVIGVGVFFFLRGKS